MYIAIIQFGNRMNSKENFDETFYAAPLLAIKDWNKTINTISLCISQIIYKQNQIQNIT